MKSVFLLLLCAMTAVAQSTPDPALLRDINSIRAVDDHSHPPQVVPIGARDDNMDALPCDDRIEPGPTLAKLRPDNPEFIEAWKSLYGYRYNDAAPEHVRELMAAKQRVRSEQGDKFMVWMLDRLGIEAEIANRVQMGTGLVAPRYRWIPFADPLMYPLDNSQMANTPDRKFFFRREGNLLRQYAADSGVQGALPTTLADYISQTVLPTLQRWQKQNAVGVKFEAAYLRALDFAPASESEAAAIYGRYHAGGTPSAAEYKTLQDFLFVTIVHEAGRLRLPIQIHTGLGCGTYFDLGGANPLNLGCVLDDPDLRNTNFVLLHGSWPFTRELAFLMTKPNVYADFSEITWFLSPREISHVLRPWFEMFPEKVLFGTDLFANTPEIGVEEIGWVTTRDARLAVALALTGMMQDGYITRQCAGEIARGALRENAIKLYNLE
jgi:predicted TIM-barrel fold metal-dependent hydrolase